MADLFSELSRAQSRAQPSAKQLSQLDLLIGRLEEVKDRLEKDSEVGPSAYQGLQSAVQGTASKLQDGQKEYYNALNKLQKTADKRYAADLGPLLPAIPEGASDPFGHMYFSRIEDQTLIDQVIADHLIRDGKMEAARAFAKEAPVPDPDATSHRFQELHDVLAEIQQRNLHTALEWAAARHTFLTTKDLPLLFELHRSHYIQLLLSDTMPLPPSLETFEASLPGSLDTKQSCKGPALALTYARHWLQPFFPTHGPLISRLLAAALYAPLDKLLASSYADVLFPTPSQADQAKATGTPAPEALPQLHASHLSALFATAYCAYYGLPRESPLSVTTSIGGGGALAKIAKARSVMQSRGAHWSQSEELPIEIGLREEERFHSVFACPVSKEQSTDRNPPMRMVCGHVIAKDSLDRLAKSNDRIVKCPYCPNQASASSALRVYF